MKLKTLNQFIIDANIVHNNKYDYSKTEYTSNKKEIIIIFEGVEYLQRPDSHLQGKCPEKVWKRNRGLSKFISDAKKVHGGKYDYSNSVYTKGDFPISIICTKHGEFKQLPNEHLWGKGCSKCNESKGEKGIRIFLESNNINYEYQKTFDDCIFINRLRFDYYLPDYNLCIEFDGKQHFEPNSFFGGIESFEQLKLKDKCKNDFCLIKNINLLRIPYYEEKNIENIIHYELHKNNTTRKV